MYDGKYCFDSIVIRFMSSYILFHPLFKAVRRTELMNILLFLLTCVLTICVVILFTIVKEHEDAIVKLESLLNDVNKSIGTNTTIVRNHTDILSELREDIKILNNEVF